MENKKLELFIVVIILFYLIYFLSYTFYFDKYCSKFSSNIVTETLNMDYLAKCKDSIVCEITNQGRTNIKLETWSCTKKKVNVFELKYYLSQIK
jgi:exopolysaccharide biosynthesis protein